MRGDWSISVTAATRCVPYECKYCISVRAPMECPTNTERSSPKWSSISARSQARRASVMLPRTGRQLPWPRASQASTQWRRARRRATGIQSRCEHPTPCTNTSGEPAPSTYTGTTWPSLAVKLS